MADEYSEYELDFFRAVDGNTRAEQSIFDALLAISDDQYYTLFEVDADHICGRLASRSSRNAPEHSTAA